MCHGVLVVSTWIAETSASQPLHTRAILTIVDFLINPQSKSAIERPCSSVVEHFLGKEGVTGSIPVVGFGSEKKESEEECRKSFNYNVENASAAIIALQKTKRTRPISWSERNIVPGAGSIPCTRK